MALAPLFATVFARAVTDADLQQLEVKFEQRLAALQSQVDSLRQENMELRQGTRDVGAAAGEGGRWFSEGRRRLDSPPASQRTIWHNGMLHCFDVPSTCGLNAELHTSDGPLMIQRSEDGNLTMLYDTTGVAMETTAPIKVTHPSGCESKTLTLDGDVEIVGGLDVDSESVVVGGSNVGQELTWRMGLVFELLENFPGAAQNQGVTYNSADSSFAFDATANSNQGSYVRVIKPVDKDFTIYFEIKTTMNTLSSGDCASSFSSGSPYTCEAGGASNAAGGGWWEGVGLMDSEKQDAKNDFGVSIAAGRIMFGVGHTTNTAITLFSATSVNDGAWHTVRASRSIGGMMRLYIDGTLEASKLNDGQVSLLTDTSNILIGAILNELASDATFSPLNPFTGSLRNVRIYDSFS